MRVPGPGTRSRGATDNPWAPVVQLSSFAEDLTVRLGVVRVGERPKWELDHGHEIVWWIQRVVTAIRRISPDDAPPAQRTAGGREQSGEDTA
jgi:hypothetical protein